MSNTEHLSFDQRENHANPGSPARALFARGGGKPSPVRPALCTHIMPSGANCGSCAVSGTALCYHHSVIKTALGKAATASNIPFVFPEDRTSIQINYFLLLQAYTKGRIDRPTFNSMQRLLRSTDSNLGKMGLAEDNANATEASVTAHYPSQAVAPEKEMKKPGATVTAPSHKPQPSERKPLPPNRPQPKASNAPFSFENIAAQHMPLGEACFLNTPSHSRHAASAMTAS